MAVFGKVSSRLAPRAAIDNEFFRWPTKPKVTRGLCLGNAAAGSHALSALANVMTDRPRESGWVAVGSCFLDCRVDMTIVERS
jgi:hypothetical protein